MGKGDKKSRRGKIIIGTYGVRRPKKNRTGINPLVKTEAPRISAKKPEVSEPPKEKKKAATKKVSSEPEVKVKPTAKKKATSKDHDKSDEIIEKTEEESH